MYCSNCGKNIGESRVCSNCGSSISHNNATPKISIKKEEKKKFAIIAIVIVMVASVIAGSCFIFWYNSTEQKEKRFIKRMEEKYYGDYYDARNAANDFDNAYEREKSKLDDLYDYGKKYID